MGRIAAKRQTAEVRKLHLSPADLADRYARARSDKSAAEKVEKDLRRQVLNRLDVLGVEALVGAEAVIERSVTGRWLLDEAKLLRLLSAEQIESCRSEIAVTNLTISAVPMAAKEAAA
jgi:hypothetical protein